MQSSSKIITNNKPTSSFLQAGCHSCRQPTVSKHWSENITFHGLAYPKLTWGLPTLFLTTNSSWLPWGRVAMPLISPLIPVPQSPILLLTRINVEQLRRSIPTHCQASNHHWKFLTIISSWEEVDDWLQTSSRLNSTQSLLSTSLASYVSVNKHSTSYSPKLHTHHMVHSQLQQQHNPRLCLWTLLLLLLL